MDIMTSLLMAASFRKAAALQQWLEKHESCARAAAASGLLTAAHDYYVKDAPMNDACFFSATCICGERADFTVVVTAAWKITKTKAPALTRQSPMADLTSEASLWPSQVA